MKISKRQRSDSPQDLALMADRRAKIARVENVAPKTLMGLPKEILHNHVLTHVMTDRQAFDAFSRVSKEAFVDTRVLAKRVITANLEHTMRAPRAPLHATTPGYTEKPFSAIQERVAQGVLQQDALTQIHTAHMALQQKGRFDQAEALVIKAIEDYPTSAGLHADWANLLALSSKFKEAAEQSRKALELGLNQQGHLGRQARIFEALGSGLNAAGPEEAERCFRAALVLDPLCLEAQLGLGGALLSTLR